MAVQADEPSPESIDINEMEWWDEVKHELSTCMNDSNDVSCKPIAASVILDNTPQHPYVQQTIASSVDSHPITLCDNDGFELIPSEMPTDVPSNNIDTNGEILVDDVTQEASEIDPVIKALLPSQQLLNSSWNPNLNTILEETVYDLRIANDKVPIVMTSHVSTKRHRGRHQRSHKLHQQHNNKNSEAISKNGIYQTALQVGQNDGGANRSVTPNKELLINYKPIKNYAVNGIQKGDPALQCTGMGYLPWQADIGELLLVRCLYCNEASGTIISPSDVNMQYKSIYDGWTMETKFDSKIGQLTFNARDGVNHLVFPHSQIITSGFINLTKLQNKNTKQLEHK